MKNIQNYTKILFNQYKNTHSQLYLQIGSYNNAIPGWFNTDIIQKIKHHIFMLDATKRFPFEDNLFSAVFSEHMIEHISFQQQMNMLRECFRVLKPNGILRICCPSLEFLVDMYLHQNEDYAKEYAAFHSKLFDKKLIDNFGENNIPFSLVFNNYMKMWGHQNILDFNTLKTMLEKCGFANITRQKIGKSKYDFLCNIEKHNDQFEKITDLDINQIESICVEAEAIKSVKYQC